MPRTKGLLFIKEFYIFYSLTKKQRAKKRERKSKK